MNFVPNDLQNIVFKKSLFGYNAYQVEDVLEKVVEDFAELIKENARLKEKLEDSQDKLKYYKGIETSLQNSLIVAQQTSEDIIANARKTAENILKEADLKSRQIIEEANHEVLGVRFEYERVKRDVESYKAKIESIIRSQLKAMSSMDEVNGFDGKAV
ncbi:MAG: DivIVA domain-containing protein [Clostridia bacterium]|nr:DivIVA domain-containing protein [Clostridia bacterium]